MNTRSDRLARAFDTTARMLPEHWHKLLLARCRGPAAVGSVTDFTDPAALEAALRRTTWSPYTHPAIQAGCVAFCTTELGGTQGVLPITDVSADAFVTLGDAHATGFVAAEVEGVFGPRVDMLVMILGPEQGVEVVYTFHPGPPLAPSTLPAEGRQGTRIPVSEARALGFEFVKIRPGPPR